MESDFLTPEECAEVDRALLSSKEKFSARLAIYALRVLKQVAGETGLPVTEVSNQQVMDWVRNDESIQQSIQVDASFELFFTNLVVASLRPLRQIAVEAGGAIEQLTVKQVVAWFEKDAKIRRE